MNCLICRSELTVKKLGDVEIDVCPNCLTTWFDKGELETITKMDIKPSKVIMLLDIFNQVFSKISKNQKRVLICPKCNVIMDIKMINFVEIDVCPKCKSIWLDKGELSDILKQKMREFQTTLFIQKKNAKNIEDILNFLEKNLNDYEKMIEEIKNQSPNKLKIYLEKAEKLLGKNNFGKIKDKDSGKFLITALYLEDKYEIAEQKDMDYSPIILEYCKVMEKECLDRIFMEYKENIILKNLIVFKKIEKEGKLRIYYLWGFLIEDRFLSLEGMIRTMEDVENAYDRNHVLFTSLKDFLERPFRARIELINRDKFIKILRKIKNKRNKTAHLDCYKKHEVQKCKKEIIDNICWFLDHFK